MLINGLNLFYCEGGEMLEHVALRGFGISVFGSTQHLTGQGPEGPAVAAPALRREVGVPEVAFNLSYSEIGRNARRKLFWASKE